MANCAGRQFLYALRSSLVQLGLTRAEDGVGVGETDTV